MAKCTACGSDTELYAGGVPLCVKCSEERDAKRKPGDEYRDFRNNWQGPDNTEPDA
jgi:hypothetical protein